MHTGKIHFNIYY